MNAIAIELKVDGSTSNIEKFITDFSTSQYQQKDFFSPFNCHDDLTWGGKYVKFISDMPPYRDWLNKVNSRYNLQILCFWHDLENPWRLGFVDAETEYRVEEKLDLKRALKWLNRK